MSPYLIWLILIYLTVGVALCYFIVEIIQDDELYEKLEDDSEPDEEFKRARFKAQKQMFFQGDYILGMLYLVIPLLWLPFIIYISIKGDEK